MPLVFASLPFLFGICLHLFAYRELGFRAGTALLPNGEGGKDEKGARNLKSRFQFFLRCCEV